MCLHEYHGAYVEVIGQLGVVGSLLSCGFQGLNSGCQTWEGRCFLFNSVSHCAGSGTHYVLRSENVSENMVEDRALSGIKKTSRIPGFNSQHSQGYSTNNCNCSWPLCVPGIHLVHVGTYGQNTPTRKNKSVDLGSWRWCCRAEWKCLYRFLDSEASSGSCPTGHPPETCERLQLCCRVTQYLKGTLLETVSMGNPQWFTGFSHS